MGCHRSYPLQDSPDPSKAQSTVHVGTVLSICTAPGDVEPASQGLIIITSIIIMMMIIVN
jgi:hypothetical protein